MCGIPSAARSKFGPVLFTITDQGGGSRPSPAVSDWPPDSSRRRSRKDDPACPRQLGSPRSDGAPRGSGCGACRRKWAAGHKGQGAPAGAQCLFSLKRRTMMRNSCKSERSSL